MNRKAKDGGVVGNLRKYVILTASSVFFDRFLRYSVQIFKLVLLSKNYGVQIQKIIPILLLQLISIKTDKKYRIEKT